MNCKFCDALLEDGVTVCPVCGKDNAEPAVEEAVAEMAAEETAAAELPEMPADEAEQETAGDAAQQEEPAQADGETPEEAPVKAKPKAWKIILAVVCGVVLLAILACAVLYGLGIDLRPRENDINYKDSYTVDDDKAVKNQDKVVATLGDLELTNSELQVYYVQSVYSFLNNNYYYLSYLGLDTTAPLDEQYCYGDETMTWQQYFLESALSNWQYYATWQQMAQNSEFVMDESYQEFLDGLDDYAVEAATSYGYDSVEAWLNDDYGAGVTKDGYLHYIRTVYEGLAYQEDRYAAVVPADADVEAYFTENEATFSESGVTKEGKYYDVRHILISVEGGTEDEEGNVTYSDQEWETCRSQAQALLDQWAAGDATEDSFATLAEQYSADGGSNTDGGLYSDLTTETNFVDEFKNWYLDENRQVGDTGLVKSTYGYHIMYFSGAEDIWFREAYDALLEERMDALYTAGTEQYPMEVNYKRITLGNLEIE